MLYKGVAKLWAEFFTCGIGDVFACSSTAKGAMDKRRQQRDSSHQIVPEIPLHGILMVVVTCCTGGECAWAEFFTLRNWRCFCLWVSNQRCYDKTETTAGFSALNRSRFNPLRCSDCRLMLYKVVKKLWAEFYWPQTLEMFWLTLQQSAEIGTNGCTGGSSIINRISPFLVCIIHIDTFLQYFPRAASLGPCT
jgi:hypothetical protein